MLLEQGLSRFQPKDLIAEGDLMGTREVLGGENRQVELLAAENFRFHLAQGEQPYILLSGSEFSYAPVVSGGKAGFAYVMLGDKAVGRVPLVYGQTIEQKQEERTLWDKLFGGGKHGSAASETVVGTGSCIP